MNFSPSSYLYTSGSRGSVSQIYDIFRGHINSLFDRQSTANQAIDEWSLDLINQIRDHARKQKNLVEEAYKTQRQYFETMRDQFVETGRVYEQKNDTEEIKRLLEKCGTLQMELVNIKFPSIAKEFIEVTPVEPPDQMNQEELNTGKGGDNKFENQSTGRSETGSAYDKDLNSGAYSKPTASTSERAYQPTTTQSTYNYTRSESSNITNDPKTNFSGNDNSNEKCPMCFMIFPSYMSERARSMHVDEHCKDD